MSLHSRAIMDNNVVQTVKNIVKIGEEQYKTFVKERLIDRSKPVSEVIKKNSLATFSTSFKKTPSKQKAKIQLLKEDCALFSRLYIACQNRDGNLEDFFKYENQPWPPSLAEMGQLRSGQKADLVKCLQTATTEPVQQPIVDAIIFDGAVLIQMLSPGTAHTFAEYLNDVFAPFVLRKVI